MRPATLANVVSNDGRPAGVTAIAIIFLSASAYLLVLGVVKLANPEVIPLSLGDPLLHGLEIYGPYMFLLAAAVGLIVAFGLFRMKNLARRAAIAIAVAGMVMLLPKVSAAATDISARFFVAGSMVVARMVIVWYLWQSWTAEKFS